MILDLNSIVDTFAQEHNNCCTAYNIAVDYAIVAHCKETGEHYRAAKMSCM